MSNPFSSGKTRKKMLRWLVQPAASLQDPNRRNLARSISSMLLVLTFVIILGAFFPTAPQKILRPAIMILIVCYALSRTRYYSLGAFLAIVALSAPSFFRIVTGPDFSGDRVVAALVWLTLPILLARYALPTKGVIILLTS